MSTISFHQRLGLGALAAMAALALLLAHPSASSAANLHCGGYLAKADEEESLSYTFGCNQPIIGYVVTFDQAIEGFDTEVPVLDKAKNATNELFSCEGGFPSFGVHCFGTYSVPGNELVGTVGLPRDACADPRYKGWLTVITNAKGQMAGPFALKGPYKCPTYTSPIKRLMAWIELLKNAKQT